jgi:hypothetical protein
METMTTKTLLLLIACMERQILNVFINKDEITLSLGIQKR